MTRAPNVHASNIYHLCLDSRLRLRLSRRSDLEISWSDLYGAKSGWTQFYSCRTSHQSCEHAYTTIYSNNCNISQRFITMLITTCPWSLRGTDIAVHWCNRFACGYDMSTGIQVGQLQKHAWGRVRCTRAANKNKVPGACVARMMSFQIFYRNRMQSVTIS